jgi:FAD/FMN-containing dehydrogenase
VLTRRRFLAHGVRAGAALALVPACRTVAPVAGAPEQGATTAHEEGDEGVWVNDLHSRLNRTRVARVLRPDSTDALQALVRQAGAEGRVLCASGGRHAMGGQQFARDAWLIDTGALRQVGEFDAERGQIEVGAGIQWPELIDWLVQAQQGRARSWGIVQKQTGADRLSLGGALSANAHGRGLTLAPIAADVESLLLVDARGELRRCSRSENPELFALVLGGYGLFGIIASVRLRLAPRRKLERVVEEVELGDVAARIESRVIEGYPYGDFQFSTDPGSDQLLRRGIFSCYRPAGDAAPIREGSAELSEQDWRELLYLGHVDRAAAYRAYVSHYLATSGQVYWSDTHQLSTYIDDYHSVLGARLGDAAQGSEMISELYVPRDALVPFMEQVRRDFLEHAVPLVYGTVRFIERDRDSFLPWARERWACIVFNLHTQHDAAALARTAAHFRRLIDRAIAHGGSYFLTYHGWATREQLLACYPRFAEFLRLKLAWDPAERFQSEWYRHQRALLEGAAGWSPRPGAAAAR